MRLWVQDSGTMLKPDFSALCRGYAGRGKGKNNPAMQFIRNVGPLPCGLYIAGAAYTHPKLGPVAMQLYPVNKDVMLGRSDFFIHDDSPTAPGEASEGCIVIPTPFRKEIDADRMDRLILVVSTMPVFKL